MPHHRKAIGIGETVFDIFFRDDSPIGATPGGSTYNSMISLGRAGIPAEFISEVGDDRVGQRIRRFLEENGVSSRCVCIHRGQKSALSLAFLDENCDAQYVFYKDHARDRLEFDYPEIAPDDVVLFGSYYAINPVVHDQVGAFLEYARERGAILYYDVNFRASHRAEAEALAPVIRSNMALADVVRGSSEDFGILYPGLDADGVYRDVVSPCTANGIFTAGSGPVIVRSGADFRKQYDVATVPVVSTVGAGDSFNAGFLYGLIRHGITRDQLRHGMTESQWDAVIAHAMAFSREVCQRMENYIAPKSSRP